MIDNQKELVASNAVLDREFINSRISGQITYALEILKSDRPDWRKKELIESALGTAVNFANSVGDAVTLVYLGIQLYHYSVQSAMVLGKPRPGIPIENSLGLPLYR